MSLEMRGVIHFFERKGTSNREIFSKLKKVHGAHPPTPRTIQNWTANLADGHTEIGADVTRPTVPWRTIGTKRCMSWIKFSRAGIGVVVMLPPGQSFNRDFSVDNVLSKIIDGRIF
jgi:hypothetical protein